MPIVFAESHALPSHFPVSQISLDGLQRQAAILSGNERRRLEILLFDDDTSGALGQATEKTRGDVEMD